MNIVAMSNCALREISNLATEKTPEQAMRTFCKNVLTPYGGYLYSFYIFSEAVQTPGKVYTSSSLYKRKYGAEFAAFIVENKLGTVTESPTVVNTSFHPDHSNTVYVWALDQLAVKAWAAKDLKAQAEALAATKVAPVAPVAPAGFVVPVLNFAPVEIELDEEEEEDDEDFDDYDDPPDWDDDVEDEDVDEY